MSEVSELVIRAQGGERRAYGELFERFQSTVYSIALSRLRKPVEAEELVQEVFVHAMTRLGQLRDVNCFAGWLRMITERMAINRVTRQNRAQGAEPGLLENVAASADEPLEDLVRTEKQHEVRAGLSQLKPMDRDTLLAFYFHGHSLERMSRDFETPIGTIKRRLHVARNRLRAHLETEREQPVLQERCEAELMCV